VARLIVLAGLPATGKSTIARELAERTGAVWLRIDSIAEQIRASGVVAGDDLRDAPYRAAYAVAEDNLRLGRDNIADCVNDCTLTRDAWQAVSGRAGAQVVWLEIVCSDPAEHRRRVETRPSDVPGLALPDWPAVIARDYHPWDRERLVIDTAGGGVAEAVEHALAELA
jgi:predicted kinase